MQGEIKYMSDIFGFDDVLEGAENDTGNEFTGGAPVTNDELSGEPAGDNEKSPPHGEQMKNTPRNRLSQAVKVR